MKESIYISFITQVDPDHHASITYMSAPTNYLFMTGNVVFCTVVGCMFPDHSQHGVHMSLVVNGSDYDNDAMESLYCWRFCVSDG